MATADPLRVKDDVPTVCAIGVDRRVVGGTLTHRFCCGGNASEPRGCPCFLAGATQHEKCIGSSALFC